MDQMIAEAPTAEVVEESAINETTPTAEVVAEPIEEVKPEEAKPARTFTQEELDKIVQKRLASEKRRLERYAQSEAENKILRENLTQQTKQTEPTNGEPQPAQFKDYESYIAALTDWKVDQKLVKLTENQREQQAERDRQKQAQTVKEKLQSAADKYDDFEEVALSSNVPITNFMAQAIAESDVAGEIAYYLGSNIKDAARIAELSPVNQVKEIAKLELKLAEKPAVTKQISAVPAPLAPTGGRGSSTSASPNDADPIEVWMQKEKARVQKMGRRY